MVGSQRIRYGCEHPSRRVGWRAASVALFFLSRRLGDSEKICRGKLERKAMTESLEALPDDPFTAAPESAEVSILYELLADSERLLSVVLAGASALIPLPFIDDAAKTFFRRRLFRLTVLRGGSTLSSEELDRLLKEPPKSCCLVGCLGKAVIYPIKRLIRKLLFFLEIKRAVDQTTAALAENWLLALALRSKLWVPGGELTHADSLREAMATVCAQHGTKPLELAVAAAYRGARETLFNAVSSIVYGSNDSADGLEAAMTTVNLQQSDRVTRLLSRIQTEVSKVSAKYLKEFADRFEKELKSVSPGLDSSSPLNAADSPK